MDKKSILSDKPETLIKKFKQLLKKKGIPYHKIILFGSYAKGTAKPWSDLDLCVVSDRFGKDEYDETVMLKHIASSIEELIEPHPYHPKDLDNYYDPLAYEIKRTGKEV